MTSLILRLWHKSDIKTALADYYHTNDLDIAKIDEAVEGIFKKIQWRHKDWFVNAKKEGISDAIRQRFNEYKVLRCLDELLIEIKECPQTYEVHEQVSVMLRKKFPQFSIHEMRHIVKQVQKLKQSLNLPEDENYQKRGACWKAFNEGLKNKKAIFREHFKRLNNQFSTRFNISRNEIDRQIYRIITKGNDEDKTIQQIRKELDKAHAILRHNAYNMLKTDLDVFGIRPSNFSQLSNYAHAHSQQWYKEASQETQFYAYDNKINDYCCKQVGFVVTPEKSIYLIFLDRPNLIGQGALNEVYRGVCLQDLKPVAALWSKDYAGDIRQQQKLSELEIASNVEYANLCAQHLTDLKQSPYVSHLYATVKTNERRVLHVIPLEDGDLDDYINERRKTEELKSTQGFIVSHLLEATKQIHGQGIIIRDFKPQNVLWGMRHVIGPSLPFIQIGDLDLAVRVDDQAARSTLAGTDRYLAPEYAMAKCAILKAKRARTDNTVAKQQLAEATTTAIDNWALGLVIYRTVYCTLPPFFEGKPDALIVSELGELPENWLDGDENIQKDPQYGPLIKGLLHPDRKKRWTAAQALDALNSSAQ